MNKSMIRFHMNYYLQIQNCTWKHIAKESNQTDDTRMYLLKNAQPTKEAKNLKVKEFDF